MSTASSKVQQPIKAKFSQSYSRWRENGKENIMTRQATFCPFPVLLMYGQHDWISYWDWLITYELMLAYLKIRLFRLCMRAFASNFWGTTPRASVESTGIKDIL